MSAIRETKPYLVGMHRCFPYEVVLVGPQGGLDREFFLQHIEEVLAENFGGSHGKWWIPYSQRHPNFSVCFKHDTDAVTFKLIFEQ